MKKVILGLILYVASLTAWAQNSLSGKVVDAKSNAPLVGASVWTETANRGTVTDENGQFTLNKLPQGNLEIRVSYLGYETERLTVAIPFTGDLVVKLESKDFLTEEFIVSATRASANTPTTFSNLDKSEIAKRNLGQDIPILLNFTPSVVSYSDAGVGVGYTGLRIRGSDQTRINATINGIPLNDKVIEDLKGLGDRFGVKF